jgi:hypothetical protein
VIGARRVWHKLYSRRYWGQRGTVNRRWMLWVMREPTGMYTFERCPNFAHDLIWRAR